QNSLILQKKILRLDFPACRLAGLLLFWAMQKSKRSPLTPEGGIIKDNIRNFGLNLTARLHDRKTTN
ncbi:MAG: hypothetical protein Q7U21_06325, partial [Lutibacter sp.]|nr:hypothetical protein [Lutibacter sp.]